MLSSLCPQFYLIRQLSFSPRISSVKNMMLAALSVISPHFMLGSGSLMYLYSPFEADEAGVVLIFRLLAPTASCIGSLPAYFRVDQIKAVFNMEPWKPVGRTKLFNLHSSTHLHPKPTSPNYISIFQSIVFQIRMQRLFNGPWRQRTNTTVQIFANYVYKVDLNLKLI